MLFFGCSHAAAFCGNRTTATTEARAAHKRTQTDAQGATTYQRTKSRNAQNRRAQRKSRHPAPTALPGVRVGASGTLPPLSPYPRPFGAAVAPRSVASSRAPSLFKDRHPHLRAETNMHATPPHPRAAKRNIKLKAASQTLSLIHIRRCPRPLPSSVLWRHFHPIKKQ